MRTVEFTKRLKNEEETLDFGRKIGRSIDKSVLICLNGDLGAGKTCLTKGIAQGLDIEDDVTSPTFILVEEYEGRFPLYHFDVYRVDNPEELYFIGFEEYLSKDAVVVIEWSSQIEEALPKERMEIELTRTMEDEREVKIRCVGDCPQEFLNRLMENP